MNEVQSVNAANDPETAASSYPSDDALFDELFAAEDQHFWFTARNEILTALLRRVTRSLPTNYHLLEIGCGTGNVLRVLEKVCGPGKVIGMDLFSGGFRYARQRTNCPLVQADMYRSPFNIQFDVICMFDVIEHLASDVDALREVSRLLRPGGRLLLTVPGHMSLWSYADVFAGHYRRYQRRELTDKLVSAGFEVEYITDFMAAIFPIMWLNRRIATWVHRKDKKQPRDLSLAELRPIPVINRMLRWILEMETIPIDSRRVLPFGTSLLAIAAKRSGSHDNG